MEQCERWCEFGLANLTREDENFASYKFLTILKIQV